MKLTESGLLKNNLNITAPKKPGETSEDQEARALLNRFLGASVIMSGAETILSDSGDSGIANQKVGEFICISGDQM